MLISADQKMTFETIYQTFSPKIYRLCMGYVNDEDWAKDLVQETFISVWKNLPKFRNEAAIGTWIYRIAVNNCLRQINRKKPTTKLKDFPQMASTESTERPNEHIVFLRQCIAELKEIDRIIISMVLEEIPQKEIAEVLGISDGNIRVKVHRIKEKISQKFKEHGSF